MESEICIIIYVRKFRSSILHIVIHSIILYFGTFNACRLHTGCISHIARQISRTLMIIVAPRLHRTTLEQSLFLRQNSRYMHLDARTVDDELRYHANATSS
jgi:hypothetical protein